jgi:N-acetylmuramoyl-L-alanine amidase
MMTSRNFPIFVLFIVSCLTLFTAGVFEASGKTPSNAQTLLGKGDLCRKTLSDSKNHGDREKWLQCINLYLDVVKRYPDSDEAPLALYRAARVYTKLYAYSGRPQDLDDAIELYRRVVNEYPTNRVADDSQYRIGEIYYVQKNDLPQAYVEFLKVDIKFPNGDMRAKAMVMLDKVGEAINKKEDKQLALKAPSQPTDLIQVQHIRHWSTPTYTRVVVDLEKPVPYESKLLKEDRSQNKPARLYVDLKGACVTSDIDETIPIGDGLLKSARAAQYSKDTVRVVLDIDSIEGYKIFPLYDPFRIVVDVQGANGKQEKVKEVAKAEKRAVRRGVRKAEKPDEKVSLARQLGLTVRKIVIDPGHGGKDPGCFLDHNVEEKNIVLNLAQILAKKLEERLKVEAVLTRNTDVFVPLEKRTAFANMQKADLFLSLHVNSYKQGDVSGVETYFLNMATDERAVMLAARENATSEKNISDLQKILNDLMLNTKISESSKLAYDIQKGIIGQTKKKYDNVRDLGVKQAPFYVLIGADMPAILVETGFLSNPTEKKRLESRKYLESIADGIVSGIENYVKSFGQAPVRG